MPKAHGKSKKRPRSPPSRWESEASDGADPDAEAVLERRTKNRVDIRSASRGKGIRHDGRPASTAKDKTILRMREPEMQRDIR
jgi:hypothetical protein